MKLRKRKFGTAPDSPFKTVGSSAHEAEPLELSLADSTLGLTVVVKEHRATGKLIAEASCSDPAMKGKAGASVAVIGREEFKLIRKTVKMDQSDERTGGCRGSADLGLLKDAVATLGPELGLVTFMLIF